jgi:hypothetical protein
VNVIFPRIEKIGDMEMKIETMLEQYKALTYEAMELRLAVRNIKQQLAKGGGDDWLVRAKRALHYKSLELARVKDEIRAYRIVLKNTDCNPTDTIV